MFVMLGWEAIEDHFETGQTVVLRWMREVGEFRLIELRRAYMRKIRAAAGFATITGLKPGRKFGGIPEMRSGDPALEFMPIRRMRRQYERDVSFPPLL
ncbi:hypothetical protein U1872_08065 [Sphingomonas sp. RB3P16]|uniref:hypothetical protein n=1 Tax=Parasphingomonas frigoris TaxID=3096163 RepID=UPI002FCAC828